MSIPADSKVISIMDVVANYRRPAATLLDELITAWDEAEAAATRLAEVKQKVRTAFVGANVGESANIFTGGWVVKVDKNDMKRERCMTISDVVQLVPRS